MSVFICPTDHIALLAAYIVRQVTLGNATSALVESTLKDGSSSRTWAAAIARELARANIASAATMYPQDKDGERPGAFGAKDAAIIETARKRASDYAGPSAPDWDEITAGEMLVYSECYVYQAQQGKDWPQSAACSQMARLVEWFNAKHKRPRVDPHRYVGLLHPWVWLDPR
jgi:hypothetical protein